MLCGSRAHQRWGMGRPRLAPPSLPAAGPRWAPASQTGWQQCPSAPGSGLPVPQRRAAALPQTCHVAPPADSQPSAAKGCAATQQLSGAAASHRQPPAAHTTPHTRRRTANCTARALGSPAVAQPSSAPGLARSSAGAGGSEPGGIGPCCCWGPPEEPCGQPGRPAEGQACSGHAAATCRNTWLSNLARRLGQHTAQYAFGQLFTRVLKCSHCAWTAPAPTAPAQCTPQRCCSERAHPQVPAPGSAGSTAARRRTPSACTHAPGGVELGVRAG